MTKRQRIVADFLAGRSVAYLARKFKVSRATVEDVLRRTL